MIQVLGKYIIIGYSDSSGFVCRELFWFLIGSQDPGTVGSVPTDVDTCNSRGPNLIMVFE